MVRSWRKNKNNNDSWELKRGTRKSYEASSGVYDGLYSEEQFAKHSLALKMLDVSKRDMVLDNGCGSGLFSLQLAQKGALLVGVDLSFELLRAARKALKVHGSEAFFVCCDSDFLPFIDGVFDKVFAITLLQNLPNPKKTIEEMKRVTKDYGSLLLTFLKKAFALDEAQELVRSAGLMILVTKDDEFIKDYLLLCTKIKDSREK
jgi:ubiquinone/menaquinone biosynthesis C-methylase UbiE